jgi:hypothetical protein
MRKFTHTYLDLFGIGRIKLDDLYIVLFEIDERCSFGISRVSDHESVLDFAKLFDEFETETSVRSGDCCWRMNCGLLERVSNGGLLATTLLYWLMVVW